MVLTTTIFRTKLHPFKVLLIASAVTALTITSAHAVSLSAPQLNAAIQVGGVSRSFDLSTAAVGTQTALGDDTYGFAGTHASAIWNFTWDLQANADPFISGNLSFTNVTASNQTFNVVFTLPITPAISTAVSEYGELGFTLSDANNSGGATLSQNQWHGLINPGSSTLQDLSLLLGSTSSCGGTGCTTALAPPASASQFHAPGNHPGNPVINSIGIHLNFGLSPGDTVTYTTRYEVIPAVPLPATAPLLVAGLGILSAMGRRHSLSARRK